MTNITFGPGVTVISGGIAELATGETISGFVPGDTIILDGYSATSESYVSSVGLELNGGAETLIVNPLADGIFDITSDGENSTITGVLSTISRSHDGGITLGVTPPDTILSITGTGTIIGGAGEREGLAGDGVLGLGIGTIINSGSILGGMGGQAYGDNNEGGRPGYQGGMGVSLAYGGLLISSGIIKGGQGGYGDDGMEGGPGGYGGAGVELLSATLANTGTIQGGVGAVGTASSFYGNSAAGGTGGTGGDLYKSTLTNAGIILGGLGGAGVSYGEPGGNGGSGGIGVVLYNCVVTNTGTIQGGNGAVGSGNESFGGNGGAGVELTLGTLVDSGAIYGGAGAAGTGSGSLGSEGDAVIFGSLAATLAVEAGAVFKGLVVANGTVADVLELAGRSGRASGRHRHQVSELRPYQLRGRRAGYA